MIDSISLGLVPSTEMETMASLSPRSLPWSRSRRHDGNSFRAGNFRRVRLARLAALAAEQPPADDLTAQEFFKSFLRERHGNGDFISKVSDMLWRSEVLEVDETKLREKLAQIQKLEDSKDGDGFLRPKNWSLGLDASPTDINQGLFKKEKEKDEFRRRNLLEYEALKRELSLVTVAVGLACSVYCLAVFSIEAAVSYGIGVFASWLYLQLLAYQVDRTSEENVPQIFLERRRRKRIGITSRDLQDSFEKNFQGIRYAFSSPRLLLPVALYGLWIGSNHLNHDSLISFKLQVAPMLLGFFAYKAAALVQVYRENKDLVMTFPDDTTADEAD